MDMFIWRRASCLGRATQVRGLDFTSLLDGIFLALLAGMDLARSRNRRASPSEYVYMENSSPPRRDLAIDYPTSRLGGLSLI